MIRLYFRGILPKRKMGVTVSLQGQFMFSTLEIKSLVVTKRVTGVREKDTTSNISIFRGSVTFCLRGLSCCLYR